MNIFSCFRAIPCFLYFNELIYNILCLAQKAHKFVRFVQKCTKIPFVRTAEFCTKLVRILCKLELVVYQGVARAYTQLCALLHKMIVLILKGSDR